jgi:hypothetical protein
VSAFSSELVTAHIALSNSADPRFATCQPSGWAAVPPASRFSFSPAVCPSGWTAYDLGTTAASVSTAYCCARFASYLPPLLRMIALSNIPSVATHTPGQSG